MNVRQQRKEALQAMLDADPNDGFALYGLAMELKVDDDLDEAIALLKRLVALDPGHHYAWYQLGEVLLADGEDDAAAEAIEAGIARARADGATKALGELMALLDEI